MVAAMVTARINAVLRYVADFDKREVDLTIKPDDNCRFVLIPRGGRLGKDAALFKLFGGRLVLENLRFRLTADRARVPAIVASPYTPKNFVIGRSPEDACDHTSVLATVEKRFALAALSQRDAAARTLESALALGAPRLSPDEARLRLPDPLADSFLARFFAFLRGRAAPSTAPMSTSQRVQLTLAHACNLEILDTDSRPDARRRYLSIRKQQDAADYIQDVETRIRARRRK